MLSASQTQSIENAGSRITGLNLRRLSFFSDSRFIAALALAGIIVHLYLRFAARASSAVLQWPLILVLAIGGSTLILRLARNLLAREFGSDQLAGISIVTSVLLGQYLVGAVVILMLSGGTALEQFASRRASSVLNALAKRMPLVAHRKENDLVRDVALSDIRIGDEVIVLPYEACPIDGSVIDGSGKMNEAYLTGEPFEIAKVIGSAVLSGSLNGDSALTIRAQKLAVDSRYAKIMRVMEDAEQRRPRIRRLGDLLGAWYTPAALAIAAIAWAATGESQRFLGVLVVATPCPLLIAIPVAVIGAISLSARRGIIVKNPAILEQISQCHTMIFDKTGTLTFGEPSLSQIVCAPGIQSNDLLRFAASVESYSKHPLAQAIQRAAREKNLSLMAAVEISERPGEGLRGRVDGHSVWITGRAQAARVQTFLPPLAPGLECVVFVDGLYAATLQFHDAPRSDSFPFVRHLKSRHRVNHVLLVSGDRPNEVQELAAHVGIKEVFAAKSPEEKVAIVRGESVASKTLFLGDGINDAPAMQAATVGIAFGAKSDITSEAADAVVLETSLSRVDELLHIGRRMRNIALQSALGGMALSIIGMVAAALGYLPPIGGAIAQEIIDLAAVLNAIRAAIPPAALTDF